MRSMLMDLVCDSFAISLLACPSKSKEEFPHPERAFLLIPPVTCESSIAWIYGFKFYSLFGICILVDRMFD